MSNKKCQLFQKENGCRFNLTWITVLAVMLIISGWAYADGDLDLYLGADAWQRNDNTVEPGWTRRPEWDLPYFGIYQQAIFDDFDDDGDLDAYVTHDSNPLLGFENIGSATGPVWLRRFDWDLHIEDIQENKVYAKAFVDLDDDGDLDLTIAKHDLIRAYRNVGGDLTMRWQRTPEWDVLLPGENNLMHAFVDLDADRDNDIIIRAWSGYNTAFENIGSVQEPEWEERIQWVPPVDIFSLLGSDDLDGDGDYDLIVGESNYISQIFENIGSEFSPIWLRNDVWSIPDWSSRQGYVALVVLHFYNLGC